MLSEPYACDSDVSFTTVDAVSDVVSVNESRQRHSALSASILDMSEKELTEALDAWRSARIGTQSDVSLTSSTPAKLNHSLTADYMRSDRANTAPERSVKFVPIDVIADQGGDRSGQWGAIASPLSVGLAVGKAESPGQKFQRIRPRVDQTSSEVANDFNSRRTLPTIKLEQYNGSSPLETHLAKLNNCADYYNWTARDRLCHLKASLEGHAGQVIWELGPTSTEEEIIKLLRNRFGNVNQMERYRAELRSRRRKHEESIQTVYQDVCRLLALGYPGHSASYVNS